MVPVNDMTIKSGKETIRALARLFAALRGSGADGFKVSRGTMTPLEQREWRLNRFRVLAASHSLEKAAERVLQETDKPGQGELLQEYTVEISAPPDANRSLEETPRGRLLLQMAWRYGFVTVSTSRNGVRLRYVGEAHAAAMTCLGLNFAEYLAFARPARWATGSSAVLCKEITWSFRSRRGRRGRSAWIIWAMPQRLVR